MYWKLTGNTHTHLLLDNKEKWMTFSSCGLGDRPLGSIFSRAGPMININYYLFDTGVSM